MSVVVNVTFKAKDDQYQALYDTLVAILPDTAGYKGAELISCAADADDKSFHVHEVWDSIESQQAYLGWRSDRGDVEKLVAMLREPPEFKQEEHLVFG
ncbi:MAG: putative quinol monooxygenase [Paracoccaceae bacterium]